MSTAGGGLIIFLMAVWFSVGRAATGDTPSGPGTCETILPGLDNECRQVLKGAKDAGSAGAVQGSISHGAATLASSAQNESDRLRTAIAYCENRKQICQALCEEGPNSSRVPELTNRCHEIVAGLKGIIGDNCSPLVIQLGTVPLRMTSPADGIDFDVFGERAKPVPHTKVRISWFASEARESNYLLALPDGENLISGVDQLFGNNTVGPDLAARFAENGFEALRKYDGRDENGWVTSEGPDGRIDERDWVFSRLRLWHDLNGNGIAEPEEVVTLRSAGVKSIDLDYNRDFFEKDQYGNALATKSTVEMVDDSLRLIFDLWFAGL